ncbi:MAG: GTPase HflX [Aquabacterium sp.]|nr:GTPase HflX [Aquabacterium sp.]
MTYSTSIAGPSHEPRVVLVGVNFGRGSSYDGTLNELALLVESAGDVPVAKITANRQAPDAALFVGSGKADEIKALVVMHQAQAVIFDQALSPAQQRNLERHLEVEVLDRIGLILEIFADRARSHEGKLQVELARLEYLATRLVRRWSHLERQRGGVGLRGGPGETQIELDRRMIETKIKSVKERLVKVKKQRNTQRRSRERAGTFRISLVGYTNAGKSTLFNALTKAGAYTANQLFATLDTTTRQVFLAETQTSVALSDTVGFIRDLPHSLVASFEATLQEATEANVLLHVIDAGSQAQHDQINEVMRVLASIGAADLPQVLVFNKCDCLSADQQPSVQRDIYELPCGRACVRVFVSALTGEGMDVLRGVIAEAVLGGLGLDSSTNPELDPRFDMHNPIDVDVPRSVHPDFFTVRT